LAVLQAAGEVLVEGILVLADKAGNLVGDLGGVVPHSERRDLDIAVALDEAVMGLPSGINLVKKNNIC